MERDRLAGVRVAFFQVASAHERTGTLFAALPVNVASRVQGLAASRSIVVTESVVESAKARSLLETKGLTPVPRSVALSGIADKVSVYEIS